MSRLARVLSVAAAVALLGSGLVAVAAPAHAVDTTADLPMVAFTDMLVDSATHGHVFLTGGFSDGLVVRDLDGAAVDVVTNQPGAAYMALSDDGSKLYVPLRMGDAVSVIDTTSLLETARYHTGTATCPASVGVVGSKLWFGYGCDTGAGNIGSIDLTDPGSPVVTLGLVPATIFPSAPVVHASPNMAGRILALSQGGNSGMHLYDVSTGTPALVARVLSGLTTVHDYEIDPSGSRVLVASTPGPYPALSTTDLSTLKTYAGGSPGQAIAVAAGPNGMVASGHYDSYTDIVVYRNDGPIIRSYDLGRDGKGLLAPESLAVNADGSRLFAVTRDAINKTLTLHVLHDPGKALSSVALAPPSAAAINQTFTLTGSLTSGIAVPAGAVITVKRDTSAGEVSLPSRVTASSGAFTIPDKVSSRGTYGYTATWAGDGTHVGSSKRVTVTVKGLVPSLAITTGSGPYAYGARPTIVAHLGTTKVRSLSIYAQPLGGSKVRIKTGTVDANGNLSVPYTITRRTTFTAAFAGDSTYEPRWVAKALTSHVQIVSTMLRYYGTSGSYKLFRTSVDPALALTIKPVYSPACIDFTVQKYSNGAWRYAASVACADLDQYGHAGAYWPSNDPAGTRFRMRGSYRGTSMNAQTYGAWQYGKFTT